LVSIELFLEYRNLPGVLSVVLDGGYDDILACIILYFTSVLLSRDWVRLIGGKPWVLPCFQARYFLFSSSVGPIFSVV